MANQIINVKAAQEYQSRFGAAPGAQAAETERDQWKQICQELVAERDHLQEENSRLQRERDKYFKSLLEHLPPAPAEFDISPEEIAAMRGTGPSLEDLLAELAHP
jgi:hypothetical protein